ncbi:RNA polymerase sigma factor SigJ [Massilia sp. B-10]|nr:RNA polymerase sigma factor SigJ [Massilia sp. B-10]
MRHFQRMRPRMFGIAYRMLGSRADADDIVQEAWLRWSDGAAPESFASVDAWLVTIVTRLCIDRLRGAKQEREDYVGPWLPEPLITQAADSPEMRLELLNDVSTAFLLMLERLGPEERAVFLLHDIFDFDYPDLAAIVGKNEAACRQLLHRARNGPKPTSSASRSPHRCTSICWENSPPRCTATTALMASLFTPDALFSGDGGGKALAVMRIVQGAERIARFFADFAARHPQIALQPGTVNGLPGLIGTVDGKVDTVMSLGFEGDRISGVYIVRNLDKLALAGMALQ